MFEEILERYSGLDHWVLAVSGGADSLALMHMVREWVRERADYPLITVATLDHGTGAMARLACGMVSVWAESLGFNFVTRVWSHRGLRGNFYNEARKFRYAFLAEVCSGKGAILTAHHMQDNVETVLLHIERGSGVNGLCGIAPVSQINGVYLLRPMLSMTKSEIRRYLSEKNFPWIEDRANRSTRTRRTFYRHKIIPKLGSLFQRRVDLLSRNMRAAKKALEYYTRIECQKYILIQNDTVVIEPEFFQLVPLDIQRRCVVYVVSEVLRIKIRPRLRDLNRVLLLLSRGEPVQFFGIALTVRNL